MRKPVNARTAKPIRLWEADAEWLRELAFRRRVPQAVVAAEAFELYRALQRREIDDAETTQELGG